MIRQAEFRTHSPAQLGISLHSKQANPDDANLLPSNLNPPRRKFRRDFIGQCVVARKVRPQRLAPDARIVVRRTTDIRRRRASFCRTMGSSAAVWPLRFTSCAISISRFRLR